MILLSYNVCKVKVEFVRTIICIFNHFYTESHKIKYIFNGLNIDFNMAIYLSMWLIKYVDPLDLASTPRYESESDSGRASPYSFSLKGFGGDVSNVGSVHNIDSTDL